MPARVFNLAVLRLAEINRLCRDRYGGGDLYELPDDDGGRRDLNINDAPPWPVARQRRQDAQHHCCPSAMDGVG
jgi:hypothetical protein